MNPTLLIELLTEELPSTTLSKLSTSFASTIEDELKKMQFAPIDAATIAYASPRRLAVQLANVTAVQPDQKINRKGPPVAAGIKEGHPTAALISFARSCGVEVSELSTIRDNKQHFYAYEGFKQGRPLSAVLSEVVTLALKKLPAAKLMRWGNLDLQFIRPAHGLIMLHGDMVVPGEVLGLQSGQTTRGHRFLSHGDLKVPNADAYARTLHRSGKVLASFNARRELIRYKLAQAAARLNGSIAAPEALFDEVAGLVEWPVVLEGRFEAAFQHMPQECLILTMQQNQKYFPLLDVSGKLMNRFLLVCNLETLNHSFVIEGNERVLHARLADAKFFFEKDQKSPLESRLPGLAKVVYHHKIGSQLERVRRLQHIASVIAHELGADTALAARAAYLAKADLASDMVSEFPELQGIMGMYYALNDGEHAEVATAIKEHYYPRFAGDTLPVGSLSIALALADKLETLIGIWGIGLNPSGDKDPFALRRTAVGVVRIALETDLDLKTLLHIVSNAFPVGQFPASVVDAVFDFIMDRLKNFLATDYNDDEIDAVLAKVPSRLIKVRAVLTAVASFKGLPEALALAAANKRVKNILKKVETTVREVNSKLLSEAPEQALFAAIMHTSPLVNEQFSAGDFSAALRELASLREPVDAFFDGVMVMVEDPAIRNNRIALLMRLADLFNRVADISLLTE